jgi:hypothetical protein
MSDTPDRKEPALVPTGSAALTTRSSALVRRGLETLTSLQVRVVQFPPDRSMGGDLNVYDPAKNESQTLSFEACGDVTVPPGMQCALVVSEDACFDLSPLAALRPDDLHLLHLWHEEVVDKHLEHIKHLRFLEELQLLGQFTDAGLEHLGNLTGLRRLTLVIEGSHTTDSGLVFLKNLSELDSLYLLSEGTFSNAGLAYIGYIEETATLEPSRHADRRCGALISLSITFAYQVVGQPR